MLMDRMANLTRKRMNAHLKPYAINFTHWQILKLVMHNHINTPAALAELLFVENAAISHCLDQMEKCGYIQRSRGTQDDRRLTTVAISETGRQIVLKGDELAHKIIREFETFLTSGQFEAVQSSLEKALENTANTWQELR